MFPGFGVKSIYSDDILYTSKDIGYFNQWAYNNKLSVVVRPTGAPWWLNWSTTLYKSEIIEYVSNIDVQTHIVQLSVVVLLTGVN